MLEWKNELLGLYCRCAGRVVDEEVRQSVGKLTNPLNNSLNEKCSRATPKHIILDRRMVEWEKSQHEYDNFMDEDGWI